jgi:hypothetical protein
MPPNVRSGRAAAKTADASRIASLLDIAFKDYIAARVLFCGRLPLQAAVLSSTAIEKYFKAIMEFRGSRSRGHLKTAQMNSVRNFDVPLFSTFNKEFLTLLQRCYRLRYTDDLPRDFNVVVATREFLAELDFMASSLHSKFRLQRGDTVLSLLYDRMLATRDERLVSEHHVLAGQDRNTFIAAAPQLVYEVRNLPKRRLMEALYFAKPKSSDGRFLRPALTPKDASEMQINLAFEPLEADERSGT